MIGRGSLNGTIVNGFALGGGAFVEELQSDDAVGADGVANLVRRPALVASTLLDLTGGVLLTARRRAQASSIVRLLQSPTVVRRVTAGAVAPIWSLGQLRLIRRITAEAVAPIILSGATELSWAYLHRADGSRVMRVRELRALRLNADLRSMAVARRAPQMVAVREHGGRP